MKTIVGIFKDYESAESSISELTRLGLTPSDVGLLSATNGHAKDLQMNPLELPDLGQVTANPPMMALLDAQRARGEPGGVLEMLLRMGLSRAEASSYLDGIRRGAVFEAFDISDDKVADALAIMEQSKNGTAKREFEGLPLEEEGEIVIPIVEEQLYVGKREVASGLRVDTRVVSEPVERTITLIEEHVEVERRAVDRLVDAEPDVFTERILEMRTFSEEPIVTKRARIVEEVRIHKDRRERIENVRDTLRHTEVDVLEASEEGVDRFDASRYNEHFRRVYEPQQIAFERVAPAYEYGERLRRHSPHDDWSAVERGVGRNWERQNPGTWERFREAVRAGWESITKH